MGKKSSAKAQLDFTPKGGLGKRSTRSLRSMDSSFTTASNADISEFSISMRSLNKSHEKVVIKSSKVPSKRRSRIIIPQKTIVQDDTELLNATSKHLSKFQQRFDANLPDRLKGVISEEHFRHTVSSANRRLESLMCVKAPRSKRILMKALCPFTLGLSVLMLETQESQRLENELKRISKFFKSQSRQPVYAEKNISWAYHYKDGSGGPYGIGYIEIKFDDPEVAPKAAQSILKSAEEEAKDKDVYPKEAPVVDNLT